MAAGWREAQVSVAALVLALSAVCADGGDAAADDPSSGGAAAGPATGAAGPAAAAPPRTLAEAEARYAETVRKCGQLSVAAVRDECLREATRTLERDRSRLRGG